MIATTSVTSEANAFLLFASYFFSPAAQFTTTAIGIVRLAASLEGGCGIRKR